MFHQKLSTIERITGSTSGDRVQYLVFTGLSIGVLGFTVILTISNKLLFQRFLGRINPLLAFLIVTVLGFMLLSVLSQTGFAIYEKENLNRQFRLSALAALFGLTMILADTKIMLPADMNILFPESLLFYPAMGFLAEILFHILPLTVLLFVLSSFLKNLPFATIVWTCILLVALIEPVYQVLDMASSKQYPLWALITVGVHIWLFSFLQLLIFRKYDFISMYSFRLVYYLFWHIGWGYVRLRLLF